MKFLLSILTPLCIAALAAARPPVGIAYYDVDRLYDTLPALFYDDSDFTPDGRLHWTAERYERKIGDIAAVIDSMALEIVALWGVENEQVVRDLAAACHGDYSYIHRTLNSLNGLDFALLYFGDRFYPTRVVPGRRSLRVDGELDGREVTLLLCADPRMTEWAIRKVREEGSTALLLLGRTAIDDPGQWGLRDATDVAARAGRGTTRSARGTRWEMRDRILADTALRVEACDVYARRYLLDPASGAPRATYSGKAYRGGRGRSLPVYIYVW